MTVHPREVPGGGRLFCAHCEVVWAFSNAAQRSALAPKIQEHDLSCEKNPVVQMLRKRERDFDALLSTLVGLRDRAQAAEAELAKLRSVTPTAPTGAGAKS